MVAGRQTRGSELTSWPTGRQADRDTGTGGGFWNLKAHPIDTPRTRPHFPDWEPSMQIYGPMVAFLIQTITRIKWEYVHEAYTNTLKASVNKYA